MPFVHTCHLLPWKHLLSINSTILLLHHQCCIRAHGGIMQRCTMWQLEVREYALYLPPIFSLATLSRLPLDFSSGSAIFPLSLRPLVLSASSCSPFSSFLNVLFLFLLIYTLSVSLSRTHTHARARRSLYFLIRPLTHMCSHCFRHSDYNSSVPDPLCLSRSHPISSTQQGGAEPLWCCCCCCVSLRPFQGMMGYLRGGSRLWEGTIWKEYHVTL